MSITDIIKSKEQFISTGPIAAEVIADAEKKLNLLFSSEYKKYVSQLGCASFTGHELTGLGVSKRLDVVATTIQCKKQYRDIPSNWYVIEETHMDEIIIWQDKKGMVYQTTPRQEPRKIADSLADYVSSL